MWDARQTTDGSGPNREYGRPGAVAPPATWHLLDAAPDADDTTEVVRLGAWCDIRPIEQGVARLDFDVSEFAVLADGRVLTLHAERGYSQSADPEEPLRWLTPESVEHAVRMTVLPDDDDDPEDHPWDWLVLLLAVHGVRSSADALRQVPYVVELGDRLSALFGGGGPIASLR